MIPRMDDPAAPTAATADAPWFAEPTDTDPPRVGVIAEIGVNHDGDASVALALVDAAAAAGADAVKVQLFDPERLLSNQALLAGYQQGKAADAKALLAGLALGVEQLRPIGERARQRGLRFIVTPFSVGDVAQLAALGVDAVKIASPDAVNLPLLEAAAGLGKPLLVSTGACELDELGPVAGMLRGRGVGDQTSALLHCVSSYPTPRELAGLGAIRLMREIFDISIGYSDHTGALDTGALAVAAGAVVLEKHLTHDRAAPGPDHAASLDPAGLGEYIARVRDAQQVVGPAAKRVQPIEADVRQVSRQSVCVLRDLPAGHRLTAADLTVKRPGGGVPAAELAVMVGRTLAHAVRANDLLRAEDVA